jgi:hypothetical protein
MSKKDRMIDFALDNVEIQQCALLESRGLEDGEFTSYFGTIIFLLNLIVVARKW